MPFWLPILPHQLVLPCLSLLQGVAGCGEIPGVSYPPGPGQLLKRWDKPTISEPVLLNRFLKMDGGEGRGRGTLHILLVQICYVSSLSWEITRNICVVFDFLLLLLSDIVLCVITSCVMLVVQELLPPDK